LVAEEVWNDGFARTGITKSAITNDQGSLTAAFRGLGSAEFDHAVALHCGANVLLRLVPSGIGSSMRDLVADCEASSARALRLDDTPVPRNGPGKNPPRLRASRGRQRPGSDVS
jgi:hypothetical protein